MSTRSINPTSFSNNSFNNSTALFGPLKARWQVAFGAATLPSDGTIKHWCTRHSPHVLDAAFRATEKRSNKPGDEMTVSHRWKFFSSVAARLKLSQWEEEIGTERYKAVEIVWKNLSSSHGDADADVKRALDMLEVITDPTKGPSAFLEMWFATSDSPSRAQAEDLLRRFGMNMTFADMREHTKPAINNER